MCDPTGATYVAAASLVMGAGSAAMSASQQEAQLNHQHAVAMRDKQQADLNSSVKLKADRDALNAKSNAEREKAIRDSVAIQRANIKDVGKATAQAAATGVAGAGMGEIVTALYRSKGDATDVAMLNADTAQANINANLASAQTSHEITLASNIPSKGPGVSGLATAINVGKAGVDALSVYKQSSGDYPWESSGKSSSWKSTGIGNVYERDLSD